MSETRAADDSSEGDMDGMPREQLLRALAEAYERIIVAATQAAQRGVTRVMGDWGPREIVAHLAGWEVMATVRIPAIVGGMAPLEFEDRARATVMNDALNATIVAMTGDQPLDAVCGILRNAYQRDIALLRTLDERHFQPGMYVYERTRSAIWHCAEHSEPLNPPLGAGAR